MDRAKIVARFEELAIREVEKVPREEKEFMGRRATFGGGIERSAETRWISEATALIESVFPPTHSVRAQWRDVIRLARENPKHFTNSDVIQSAHAVFAAALQVIKRDGLSTIVEGIRAETVDELLDQAAQLVRDHAPVPAAVLAGGALETHLRHLCDRNGLLGGMQGHGAIEKYRGLLDQARGTGNTIISLGDAKQVTAWADDRNLAAHRPMEFTKGSEAVQLMIEGIRQFIARTGAP